MKPKKINYQSDFKLREVSETVDLLTPFRFTYYITSYSSSNMIASYDGENYTNCRRLEEGALLVVFDNHKLGVGHLEVRREYFLTDSDFADGICNKVFVESSDVSLVHGRGDTDEEITIEVYPTYQQGVTFTPSVDEEGNLSWSNNGGLENPKTVNVKGAQGDALTWNDLTTEQKEELKGSTGAAGKDAEFNGFATLKVNEDMELIATMPNSPQEYEFGLDDGVLTFTI